MPNKGWFAIISDEDYAGHRRVSAITRTPKETGKRLEGEYGAWIGKGNVEAHGPFDSAADASAFADDHVRKVNKEVSRAWKDDEPESNPSPNARDRVKIVTGEKIRTWGGWYRHDKVTLDGREIGRIQVRRRNKRTETITLGPDPSGSPNGGAVLGSDIDWLLRIAGEKA